MMYNKNNSYIITQYKKRGDDGNTTCFKTKTRTVQYDKHIN